MPLLWPGLEYIVPITAFFCVCATATLVFGLLTSLLDAADGALLGQPSDTEDRVLCYLCDVKVHKSSRHCRVCNKCVERYDHHCQWLNTCVGKCNYSYFLYLIAAVSLETTLLLVVTVLYIAEAFNGFGDIKDRAQDAFGASSRSLQDIILGVQIISIVAAAVLVPFVGMVLQLAGFHAKLVWDGITTYDFIVAEQRKQKEKQIELKKTKVSSQPKTGSAIVFEANKQHVDGASNYSAVPAPPQPGPTSSKETRRGLSATEAITETAKDNPEGEVTVAIVRSRDENDEKL